MDLTVARNLVTSRVGRQFLIGKKHSPAILFAGGVVGVVATTVTACRATLKVDQLLDRAQAEREKIENLEHVNYSARSRASDLRIVKIQLATDIAKLYAPPVIIGVCSIGALTGAHVTLTRRNAAVTAAYVALDKGFAEYRDRVEKELGSEKELEIRRNVETVERHDPAKGKIDHIRQVGPGGLSQYAKLFSPQTSKEFRVDVNYNYTYIRAQQKYANQLLQKRGHVLLNDVYEALGLERTSDGCVVGWVRGHGDDEVDFGLFKNDQYDIHEFMTNPAGEIWLDFNVDGLVYDLI